MTTFASLLNELNEMDANLPLIFATDAGEAGTGYHVTELRHSASTGIDCGGRIETFDEARLQLLDGSGGTHMRVGTFIGIIEKSLAAVPALQNAALLAEFGHGNTDLALMSIGAPEAQDEKVVLRLGAARAVCKPMIRHQSERSQSEGCCAA